MLTADFDYQLPEALIAQHPAQPRESCRLLVLSRQRNELDHRHFWEISDFVEPVDLLVVNDTKVLPARLLGRKLGGGRVELLLLRRLPGDAPLSSGGEIAENTPSSGNSALVAGDISTDSPRFSPDKLPLAPDAGPVADKPPAFDDELTSGDDRVQLWEALVKPGRRLKPGAELDFGGLYARVLDWLDSAQAGGRRVWLLSQTGETVERLIQRLGTLPLPPYITSFSGDSGFYQTVYARRENSAAAPTAGLHFSPELLARLEGKGVGLVRLNLEIGLDTFRRVSAERLSEHRMHSEFYSLDAKLAAAVARTKARGGRVIAVGTSSTRALESAFDQTSGSLRPCQRSSPRLFITPGYRFKVVDALLTNFHSPRSTLLMMVSAFAGRERLLAAYQEAIAQGYRFLSFGDAMLIF